MKHAIKHIHFVGMGGSGMSGIAEVLQPGLHHLGLGPVRQRHAANACGPGHQDLHVGHAAAHMRGADAVVTSTAVRPTTPRCWPRAPSAFPWCHAP
jgi:UDP-N-acetylmuramate--alanine ligase